MITLQIAFIASPPPVFAQEASKSPLIVHGDESYPPYESMVDGIPAGMNVDLWREIASVLDRPLDYRLSQWADAQARVLRGEGKLLSFMSYSEIRGKLYDFTTPTFASKYSMFVNADSIDLINVRNLDGKRLAVKSGGFPQTIIETLHPRAEVVFVKSALDGFRKLLRREVDGFVEDELVGYTILNQQGFRSVSAIPERLASKIGQIAATKGNPELVLQINGALKILEADGTLDQIADKWSASEAVFIKKKNLWLGLVIACILLALLASIGAIIYLNSIRKARDRFERQVATRTYELQEAKQEAERANLTKSRFLAYASHDLRQPLQFLNLLNATLSKTMGDTNAQTKILDKQKATLIGMKTLLNTLLNITRLESGSIEPSFGNVSIQRQFDTISTEFGERATAKGLTLQVEPTHAIAYTDPDLLAQIIQNLVANAIRYTDKGFVRLKCSKDSGALRIMLTDTGSGIPEQQLQNIFIEFHQLDNALHEGKGGLGLGLAIVQSLANKLDIKVDVESKVGEGSTFSFILPISTVEFVEPAAVTEVAISSTQTQTILLIDDDIDLLEAFQSLLELEGYQVATATSAEEVYANYKELSKVPDIIVTDLHLDHGESGIDIIQSLRARAGIPAILVTGDASINADMLDTENVDVMIKPIEPDQLFATIKKLLMQSDT